MSRYDREDLRHWATLVLQAGRHSLSVQALLERLTDRTGLSPAAAWAGIHILAGRA